jgi:hypothetical protein
MRVQADIEKGIPVEEAIQAASDDIQDSDLGKRQLAGLRFYLQEVTWETGSRWSAAAFNQTNYALLTDAIERWRRRHDESVAYVTFNYDRMLEAALRPFLNLTWETGLDGYTNGPTRVYKVHGLADWGHRVVMPQNYVFSDYRWMLVQQAPSLVPSANEWRRFLEYAIQQPSRAGSEMGILLYPAIALPATGKAGFECPAPHLEALDQDLARMDRLLVVGWKGQEEHFLKLLARQTQKVVADIVSGGEQSAIEVVERLAGRLKGLVASPFSGGFSDYVQTGHIDILLAAK